jgi:predicted ATPase
MSQIHSITIEGYKSIKSLVDFELRPVNVLIGANGSGKSNFIGAFRFLAALAGDNFPVQVQKWGGPDALLHYGKKHTAQMHFSLRFASAQADPPDTGYALTLETTQDNRFIFTREQAWQIDNPAGTTSPMEMGHEIAKISNALPAAQSTAHALLQQLGQQLRVWRQYHFHDTGDTAAVKGRRNMAENLRLLPDAANLAAWLRHLQTRHPHSYQRIVDTIRLAAPFFGDFVFREDGSAYTELEWCERGQPDTPWKAHMLSDGTLRFICLTTLLLQPASLLPELILIDEPELGLHPFAINLLADMLQQAAETSQVIISTQSAELLSAFQPEDVVVVQREGDATTLKRLDAAELADWLADDYSLGELWQRNILGGRPSR